MFIDEYSSVLDPTAGSGNALKAAGALGAGRVLGLERDPEFFQRAYDNYFGDENE
jgi:predicted RNA methylase